MRTVTYKSVANNIALLANAGSSATIGAPSGQEFDAINILINRRAPEFWNRYWWPDLMEIEKRYFRPVWAVGTTYAAGTEVYFHQEKRHYQCLKASTVTTPPADSTGATNTSNWYECQATYSGDDYSASTVYSPGTVVYYEATGLYYCCHTTTTAGQDPTTANRWGVLTPFVRSIDLTATGFTEVGDIKDIWDADPRVTSLARPLSGWSIQNDYVVVPAPLPYVWLEFRKRAPEWTGDDYSATASYAVGDKVYHDATGSYYEALQSHSAQTPSSSSAYWDLIEFPHDLSRVVVQAVYADMLRRSNQNDRYMAEMAEAERMLSLEIDRYGRQQQQNSSQRVATR